MWLVISDTHIGDRQSNKHLHILFEFLNNKANKTTTLVLNGDIFDLAKSLSFDERHRTFLKIIKKFHKIIYIIGNHDWFMAGLKDAIPKISFHNEYRLNINHNIIKILHGHQTDKFVNKFPQFTRFLIKFNSWFYDLSDIDIQHKMRHTWLVQKFLLEKQENRLMRVEKTANTIIAGHTHRPCVREKYGVKYYNSGDWVDRDHIAYIQIENTGEIELIKI